MNWQFLPNISKEVDGPNDAGITHFAGRVHENVIREAIQNALDVPRDTSRQLPIKVEFRLGVVRLTDMNAEKLISHLQCCIGGNADNDAETAQQMRKGQKCIAEARNGRVRCLWITDSQTTGARESNWKALTKGTGYNEKTTAADAGGSYGLGKFASFAATPLRTVLYSTMFETGPRRRKSRTRFFIGKSILVSHRDLEGNSWRSTGYLCTEGFKSLQNSQVPDDFQLAEPGTRICIPAYPLDMDSKAWEQHSILYILKHFFVALLQGKLEVKVNEIQLSRSNMDWCRDTLERYAAKPNSEINLTKNGAERLLRLMNVAIRKPDHSRDFCNVGTVNLRLVTYPKEKSAKRYIDMVLIRDIGMVILSTRGHLRKAFWPGKSVGSSWSGFTLIIEVLAHKKERSWLRDIETPAHDDVSYDLIRDRREQKNAKKTLVKEVGTWIWQVLEAACAPSESPESELPVSIFDDMFRRATAPEKQDIPAPSREQEWEQPEVVMTVERSRTQRQYTLFEPDSKRYASQRNRKGRDEPDDPKNKNRRKRRYKPRRNRTVPVRRPEFTFSGLRLREVSQDTHALTATFDTPSHGLEGIRLRKLTEDGKEVSVGVRKVLLDNTEVPLADEGVNIASWPDRPRIQLVFYTQEPVTGKTFCLVQAS